MHVEIVTHCYRYPSLLRYQLSSLMEWPPSDVEVTATVFFTPADEETAEVLRWCGEHDVPGVRWNWRAQPAMELCKRSIGRNLAAMVTKADWVWFCDADYWFTSDCWKWFKECGAIDASLIYPRWVCGHRTHALGDQCIEAARTKGGLAIANATEFERERNNRAIGGIQIVSGRYCREHGYLKNSALAQAARSSEKWERTKEDVWFRRELGSKGLAVDLPGVYRIRHSAAGRFMPGLIL